MYNTWNIVNAQCVLAALQYFTQNSVRMSYVKEASQDHLQGRTTSERRDFAGDRERLVSNGYFNSHREKL